jgi:hypothetical protein
MTMTTMTTTTKNNPTQQKETMSDELNIEAIFARHLAPERIEYTTMYEGHVLVDLASAIDEIVRLREVCREQSAAIRRLTAVLGVP